jgi:hypothetical protein
MKKLIQKKLMWGVVVMIVSGILGMLPALDFLPPIYLKLTCFGMGVSLTIAKGIEMFYDQTAQLEKTTDENYVSRDPATGTVEVGSRQTVTSTPVQPPSDPPKNP